MAWFGMVCLHLSISCVLLKAAYSKIASQAMPILARGGGGDAVAGIGKKCGKMQKKCAKCGKNAIENAVLLEWCMLLETPTFRLVLHDRALKAWTV